MELFICVFCLISCLLCTLSDYFICKEVRKMSLKYDELKNLYDMEFYDIDKIKESDFE